MHANNLPLKKQIMYLNWKDELLKQKKCKNLHRDWSKNVAIKIKTKWFKRVVISTESTTNFTSLSNYIILRVSFECEYPKIQQTKMLVTCQRSFLFRLVWQYSSVQTKYNGYYSFSSNITLSLLKVPNRRACTFINFEKKIPPLWPYLGLHVYWFWEKISPCTLIWVALELKIKLSKLKTAYNLVQKW